MWWVYIVECKDGSLYTGISNDVERRVNNHNNKVGAKSLRGKVPVKLVYREEHNNKVSAAKREREIKGWRREKKIELIGGAHKKGLT